MTCLKPFHYFCPCVLTCIHVYVCVFFFFFFCSLTQVRAQDAQRRLDALKDQLQGISLAEVSKQKQPKWFLPGGSWSPQRRNEFPDARGGGISLQKKRRLFFCVVFGFSERAWCRNFAAELWVGGAGGGGGSIRLRWRLQEFFFSPIQKMFPLGFPDVRDGRISLQGHTLFFFYRVRWSYVSRFFLFCYSVLFCLPA